MRNPTLALVASLATLCSSLVAQEVESSTSRDKPVGTVEIRVPNSRAIARLAMRNDANGGVVTYRLSLDGRHFHPPVTTSYELKLRHGEFDPKTAPVELPDRFRAKAGNRLMIVQYWTQGIEDYRREVRRSGGQIRLFLANHANIVEMTPAVAARVAAMPFVRSVTPFHPAFKIAEDLRAMIMAGQRQRIRVNLLTTRRGPVSQAPVAEWVRGQGGTVDHVSKETYLMTVSLGVDQVAGLAGLDDVQWIDLWSRPEHDMDIARAFHGANYVESQIGISGQGVRVEVMDGGCDLNHPDIQNYAVHGSNTPSAHGTCTSGIVVGSGAGNASARGALPSAFLAIADYSYMSGGSRYAHSAELQSTSLTWQCVLQSNSWGGARTRAYTSTSQEMDTILFDLQRLSILQSQSNAGNQDSRPQAWAKNIISVGGIRHYNTLSESDDRWAGGASIGPAADGRIKPDIASFYDSTLCTDQVGTAGYSSSNYYSSFGGTSGATPIVAGHLGLIYQMWHQGRFGNSASGATVFANRPNNTTAKALLINTAKQWTFSGTSHDLTRVHQGWGRPDLQAALDLGTKMLVVDESDVLTNLATKTYNVTVTAGTPALKVTMVYRDPAGTTSSTLHRINDLDLEVTAPGGGTVYHGNNGLLANMWSTSGGSPNTVDTVENVFVQNPAAGTWTVEVRAAAINQDAHVETGTVDADFALVISGIITTPPTPPAAPSNLTANATGTSTIRLDWTDNANNEDGFKIERDSVGSGSFVQIAMVGANVTTFTDSGLAPNSSHNYRVRAYNTAGDSAYSNEAAATTNNITPPAAPSNLTANATGTSTIRLDWTDNANNEDGFKIERDSGGGSFAQIATVGANVTTFTDTGLAPNSTHKYRVRAYNTAGNSASSNEASATTTGVTIPAAPSNLEAKAKGKRVELTWNDNSNNEDGFRVEKNPGTGWTQIATVGANSTSYTDSGLSSTSSLEYRVRAYNAAGNSPYSNTAQTGSKGKRK